MTPKVNYVAECPTLTCWCAVLTMGTVISLGVTTLPHSLILLTLSEHNGEVGEVGQHAVSQVLYIQNHGTL
jgi:hypothetical protein